MALTLSPIQSYVRDLIYPDLITTFTQVKALLAIMAGARVANLDRLGDPRYGVMVGGTDIGKAKMLTLNGSFNHRFRFQKSQTNVPGNVTTASTPTANIYANRLIGMAETRWVHKMAPVRIEQAPIDAAQDAGGDGAKLKIASIVEEAISMAMQRPLEELQAGLWTGTLDEDDQDNVDDENNLYWPNHIGLLHWVSDGVDHSGTGGTDESDYRYVGRVDRTVQTSLQATVLNAEDLITDGYLQDTKPRLSLLRQIRTVPALGGLANKFAGGGTLALTTPELWNVLANEAEDEKYQIHTGGIPKLGIGGFKNPLIEYGDVYVGYDPDCPEGNLLQLTPGSFCFEIAKGHNFTISDLKKKWQSEEGGGYYQWGNIGYQTRFTGRKPKANAKVTGLTVNGN